MAFGRQEIEHRFGFHKATKDTGPQHAMLRRMFIELALEIDETIPDGRDKSLAFTELQSSLMWANAAVAMTAPLVHELPA